jgi:xanthine dehydrogenase iron-sulfur cluster and FAD-binding subunit A
LRRTPHPTERQAREALAHNLCRCGAHIEILQAVQRAAHLMAQYRDEQGHDERGAKAHETGAREADPTPAAAPR